MDTNEHEWGRHGLTRGHSVNTREVRVLDSTRLIRVHSYYTPRKFAQAARIVRTADRPGPQRVGSGRAVESAFALIASDTLRTGTVRGPFGCGFTALGPFVVETHG